MLYDIHFFQLLYSCFKDQNTCESEGGWVEKEYLFKNTTLSANCFQKGPPQVEIMPNGCFSAHFHSFPFNLTHSDNTNIICQAITLMTQCCFSLVWNFSYAKINLYNHFRVTRNHKVYDCLLVCLYGPLIVSLNRDALLILFPIYPPSKRITLPSRTIKTHLARSKSWN